VGLYGTCGTSGSSSVVLYGTCGTSGSSTVVLYGTCGTSGSNAVGLYRTCGTDSSSAVGLYRGSETGKKFFVCPASELLDIILKFYFLHNIVRCKTVKSFFEKGAKNCEKRRKTAFL
jgi:hypothetical protein